MEDGAFKYENDGEACIYSYIYMYVEQFSKLNDDWAKLNIFYLSFNW